MNSRAARRPGESRARACGRARRVARERARGRDAPRERTQPGRGRESLTERAAFFLKLSFAPATLALAANKRSGHRVCHGGGRCVCAEKSAPIVGEVCQASRDHRFCGGVAASWRRSQSEANIRVKLWLAPMLIYWVYNSRFSPLKIGVDTSQKDTSRISATSRSVRGSPRHLPPSRHARRTAPPSVFRGATRLTSRVAGG